MEELPVGTIVSTTVPPLLDRLAWPGWHRKVILALGITWILGDLEAPPISAAGPVLTKPDTQGPGPLCLVEDAGGDPMTVAW
jgi:hypothetical protein